MVCQRQQRYADTNVYRHRLPRLVKRKKPCDQTIVTKKARFDETYASKLSLQSFAQNAPVPFSACLIAPKCANPIRFNLANFCDGRH